MAQSRLISFTATRVPRVTSSPVQMAPIPPSARCLSSLYRPPSTRPASVTKSIEQGAGGSGQPLPLLSNAEDPSEGERDERCGVRFRGVFPRPELHERGKGKGPEERQLRGRRVRQVDRQGDFAERDLRPDAHRSEEHPLLEAPALAQGAIDGVNEVSRRQRKLAGGDLELFVEGRSRFGRRWSGSSERLAGRRESRADAL